MRHSVRLFLLGEKRPLHLDAHQPRAALRPRFFELHSRFVRRFQHVIRKRHGRRSEARHAVCSKILRHFDKPIVVAVGEVRAGIAVIVDVDQAGDDVQVIQVNAVLCGNCGQNFGKSPVFHAEGAVLELTTHKDICIFIEHSYTSGKLAAAID